MDKDAYFELLVDEVGACLEEKSKRAVLIVYDGDSGQVKTYSINAGYETVKMLVGSAAMFITDDEEERVMN